ncbi:SIR2 family protein [Actinoplanes sp. TBRC 11911]|uniref:SIR2 family NAD-dependent protein deacylase n=1 Tax=Actinoplanes sp. TBRC 11911 TaxID=2729386 RepID=UPI00145C7713|nr:SIR2 family protein [Actinoplanes sp. TBRC 11911]NMO54566.1 SIR2 family protein [Actinoplanes sp. TBRC 11911]
MIRTESEAVGTSLPEKRWTTLVDSVLSGHCTPFLGAGIGIPHLPSGRSLAMSLAGEFEYPFADPDNLPRVAQYVATTYDDPNFVKRNVQRRIQQAQQECLEAAGGAAPENYRVLAKLGLPLFVTTNYDGLMEQALRTGGLDPRIEVCRWNNQLAQSLGRYRTGDLSAAKPGVFHMHGALENASSLLLTEDDYVDFTVSLALEPVTNVLWHHVRRRLGPDYSLLFLGYSLEDWNFRVLMKYLFLQQKVHRSGQASSLSIQLSDAELPADRRQKAESFLTRYFETSAIRVHWTDVSGFLAELGERLNAARR